MQRFPKREITNPDYPNYLQLLDDMSTNLLLISGQLSAKGHEEYHGYSVSIKLYFELEAGRQADSQPASQAGKGGGQSPASKHRPHGLR